ncbi:hypothetical protein H0H93_006263, partial [Arthromyces matolae]
MPIICKGCGISFKTTGWRNHVRQSINPKCKVPLLLDTTQNNNDTPFLIQEALDNENLDQILVDPAGDFFGNYDLDEEMPLEVEGERCDDDDAAEEAQEDDSDSDDDEDTYMDSDIGLEPLRPVLVDPPTVDSHHETSGDNKVHPALRLRGGAEETLLKKPFVVKFPGRTAGAIYSQGDKTLNDQYRADLGATENPYAPFDTKLDWEIARWAKLCGPSSTSFTELMAIEGVVDALGLSFSNARELNKIIDNHLPGRPRFQPHEILIGGEVCEVFYRDIIACIRALLGDQDFGAYLEFLPEKHYTTAERTTRMYHDMHTGKWWWSTQELLEKDKPGATIIPIIISTDKTQLTLFRNKSAYPIYMTIGNIPKEIRAKPSNRAYVLLGYLPTTRLENISNKAGRRRSLANLYHACMGKALEPLKLAGTDGLYMTTGDGHTRRGHPLLACVVIDYPEQFLTTCTFNGECPTCPEHRNEMGSYDPNSPLSLRDLSMALDILDSFEDDPAAFLQSCKDAGIKPVVDPYWKDLPYVHIYRSITPDILHQLYQGIMKHIIGWVLEAYGPAEVDARCRRMPPNHNLRLFSKGISTLTRVTGQEHDQMCRILLGLVIDAPLPDNVSSARLVRSVRAMLDFLYLAQYPVHTDKSLELLNDALHDFHVHKAIFIDLGIREHFNIPKLHWARHYVDAIKLYGTTDNVNTQYTERLHIDLAKVAYAATNHKDEFSQMTVWLERKEKILRHEQFVHWRLDGSPLMKSKEWSPPGLELDRTLHVSKHPSVRGAVSFDQLSEKYGANFFRTALARYVALVNNPDLRPAALERRIWTIQIPFRKVHVWHRIKFLRSDPLTGKMSTSDSIHVRPARKKGRGEIAARFDTALIDDEERAAGMTGID